MMAWLFPPPAMRKLLPDQRRRSAPWVVGLMTFVTLVVGATGLGVLGAVSDLRRSAEGRWSLQISGPPAEAERALALLRAAPDVERLAAVPEAEVRATLRQWLGPSADSLDLPLPTLADVDLRQHLIDLRAGLRGASPAAALLFTCNGRGEEMFGEPHHDAEVVDAMLPGVPVAGGFCNGEIGPAGPKGIPTLHGFTATLGLIVPDSTVDGGA